MNGFAGTGPGSMGYYTDDDLPFYYSLANTFTLANRWFCSAPAQTYPNRRFLMAGTASGIVSTDISNVTTYPGQRDDLGPAQRVRHQLDELLQRRADLGHHPRHHLPAPRQHHLHRPVLRRRGGRCQPSPPSRTWRSRRHASPRRTPRTSSSASNSSHRSSTPCWRDRPGRAPSWSGSTTSTAATTTTWPPPAAVAPDSIPPTIGPADQPGGYDHVRPPGACRRRQPLRPAARRHRRRARPHLCPGDHRAAVEPAGADLPRRQAATLADFLDPSVMSFADPPDLAAPANPLPGLLQGYQGQPAPPPPRPRRPRRAEPAGPGPTPTCGAGA